MSQVILNSMKRCLPGSPNRLLKIVEVLNNLCLQSYFVHHITNQGSCRDAGLRYIVTWSVLVDNSIKI